MEQVTDEKAWHSIGCVSDHAVLFSNTSDMAALMQVMLNGGGYGNASMTPTFGVLASSETYGHTGWTGTLTSIDPANHMAIVILGNRSHSPVADPKVNPNVFVSGLLPAATYGWIVDQIYGALK